MRILAAAASHSKGSMVVRVRRQYTAQVTVYRRRLLGAQVVHDPHGVVKGQGSETESLWVHGDIQIPPHS